MITIEVIAIVILWFAFGVILAIASIVTDKNPKDWDELSGGQQTLFFISIGPLGWLLAFALNFWKGLDK